jgi:hypothetical protein
MKTRILRRFHALFIVIFILVCFVFVNATFAQNESDLAKKTQNPVADLISLPLQNNINFNVGSENKTQNILNIQPVIPMQLNENWNWIHRTIFPLINQPSLGPGMGSEFGLGDILYQGFLSPVNTEGTVWGVGPAISIPTASDEVLGTEKWSAGPAAVVLRMPGRWVYGSLIYNIWSFAGESDRKHVNQMLIQPFINYNFPGGWYLTSAPIMTANWNADSSDAWTVPIGGGGGKIFRVGKQPMNASVQGFYNIERPSNGAEWTLRVQLQFLFPK